MSNLTEKLDALAVSLLEQCEGDVPIDTKIDIFKVVAAYHIGSNRSPRGKKPDAPAATFSDIVAKLNNHDGGTA